MTRIDFVERQIEREALTASKGDEIVISIALRGNDRLMFTSPATGIERLPLEWDMVQQK